MSVSILYYKVTPEKISSTQVSELINTWAEELPVEKQLQIGKLRQQNDQVLSLAGLQLLKLGMAEISEQPFSLKQLQFPTKKKPFFKGEWEGNIDFNISHSGDIAICVISNSLKVGIDIELQRNVKAATLNKFLSENNANSQNSSENDKHEFFNIWTKNEAIIKAANHGSIYSMNKISLESGGAFYQDRYWYTYPIKIDSDDLDSDKRHSIKNKKEYTCHIACSEEITDSIIKTKQIINL